MRFGNDNFGKIIKTLSMTIIEVFHCAYYMCIYVSTGLRLATEYSFKSILTENIFKTFFILVTNSVIAVPDCYSVGMKSTLPLLPYSCVSVEPLVW